MAPTDVGTLAAVAGPWGSSFLFMRVAAPALGALPLVAARLVVAAPWVPGWRITSTFDWSTPSA
jgi:hypothetical protein